MFALFFSISYCEGLRHRVYIWGRDEIGLVGECPLSWWYTVSLHVLVNRRKGVGRAPPTLTIQGCYYHHDGMYARKRPLPLCVYSVVTGLNSF
jgi:hypothetical protein